MLALLPYVLVAGIIGVCIAVLLLPAVRVSQLWASNQPHLVSSELHQRRLSVLDRLQQRLDRSQSGLTYVHYLLLSVGFGLFAYWMSSMILQSWLLALPACLTGILFTERLLSFRGSRHRERFEAENVRAIRIMASSLRTSPSYLHAFEQVANSPFIEKSVASEYRRVVELLRGQIPLDLVMRELTLRSGSEDVSYLSTIVQVQKELGGDMAKTLDLAASSILRRRQLSRRQKAAMSQILAQVNLLSAMPFLFVFTLYLNNPHHFEPLTRTAGGRFAMLGCLLSILLGGEAIRFVALKQFRKGRGLL